MVSNKHDSYKTQDVKLERTITNTLKEFKKMKKFRKIRTTANHPQKKFQKIKIERKLLNSLHKVSLNCSAQTM